MITFMQWKKNCMHKNTKEGEKNEDGNWAEKRLIGTWEGSKGG